MLYKWYCLGLFTCEPNIIMGHYKSCPYICNTTNLDNELQKNLEENENNDEEYNIKILNKY